MDVGHRFLPNHVKVLLCPVCFDPILFALYEVCCVTGIGLEEQG